MYTEDDLKSFVRALRREIEKCERTLKTKVRSAKPHMRGLYHAQRLCEEAADSLCQENSDLRHEIEAQRHRIETLEGEVASLREDLEEWREESRRTNADLQRQIDELKAPKTGKKNNLNNIMSALNDSLAAIENSNIL